MCLWDQFFCHYNPLIYNAIPCYKVNFKISVSCNVYGGQLQSVTLSRRYLPLSDIFLQRSCRIASCRSVYARELQVQEPMKT